MDVCVLVFIVLAEDILLSLKYKYQVAFMQFFTSNPAHRLPSPRPHRAWAVDLLLPALKWQRRIRRNCESSDGCGGRTGMGREQVVAVLLTKLLPPPDSCPPTVEALMRCR